LAGYGLLISQAERVIAPYNPGGSSWLCPDGVVVLGGEDESMPMTATARPVDQTLRHEVDVNERHTIVTDEPVRLGGTDAGPAPHELLPAMIAACVSTMIVTYANARGLELPDLRVDVVYDPEPTPRHVELAVHLPEGLTDGQLERLRRIVDTCPVKRALEAGFTFDDRLVVEMAPSGVVAGAAGA
jgi:putative redox protein